MAKKTKRKDAEDANNQEEKPPAQKQKPCSDETKKDSKPSGAAKKCGLDDIDDLFKSKKEKVAEQKQQEVEEERLEMEKRKFFKSNQSSGPTVKNAKKVSLNYDRTDVSGVEKNEWVNDGLGGVFDGEGFTGRKEEGVKVFKAHLFNKKGFGTSKDCPFDCECCYI